MVDAYTKAVLTVIALALVVIALRGAAPVEAGLDVSEFKAGEPLRSIRAAFPRQWGRFVGATGVGRDFILWFEDAGGTIRRSGCPACEYSRSN
jgi:hypothetical protein